MPGADESKYSLRSCNHEEFDTRVLSHAESALSYDYKRRIVSNGNDTDIIVLGISLFSYIGADKLLVSLVSNCGTFQFMTSAVRCLPPRQNLFPYSMPWQDQITHPSFLARERNLLTQNGARGQSSQPRFVIWWISQKHLLQMASLSSRASSFHCIRFLVLWRMSTKRACRYSLNRLALSSTCIFPDESSLGRALVEHVKRTTHQAGYVWGQPIIAKQVLPSPSLWGWVKFDIGWVPSWTALPRAAKVMNVFLSCGCTTSCAGSCSRYNKCMKLWLSFFIFIPVRLRVPCTSIQLHLCWRRWFLVLFGVISDVTFS